jgi:hypothetical protein
MALSSRHDLRQLDDPAIGILRLEYAYFDTAEKRIRRGDHLFFTDQAQVALRTFERPFAERRKFAGKPDCAVR